MTADNNNTAAPDPTVLMQMHSSFAASRVLTASVQLDVFSPIAAGCTDAAAVARACGATERGVRMLLDALLATGLLAGGNGSYRLAPLARQYLVRESPDYVGALFESDALWQSWTGLTDAIRTGRPSVAVDQQAKAEEFFPTLVRTLHILNREPARRAAEALKVAAHPGRLDVIDIGCGSAIWSIAVAEQAPQAHVVAQDFPALMPVVREYAERHGVAGRFDYLPGNLRDVDLGEDRYDLALLGNIVHSEGEESSRALFARLARALRPGGRIAIVDMVPDDDRSGPVYPLLFALNMLVNTQLGDTYTLAEYRAWLEKAGFTTVHTADIGLHSPMIIAERA